MEGPKVSNWQGSEKTRQAVEAQIRERWGESEVKNYDPERSALPFTSWASLGYRIRKGEKCLKSVTVVERTNAKGETVKIPRTVNLFYYRSVEPIS